jgi:hypothetical protein
VETFARIPEMQKGISARSFNVQADFRRIGGGAVSDKHSDLPTVRCVIPCRNISYTELNAVFDACMAGLSAGFEITEAIR